VRYDGLDLFRGEVTERDVARDGLAARAAPYAGMPAYESDHGVVLVMENLVVFPGTSSHPAMALPLSYQMAVARTQGGGLTALHDDPDAVWSWRPILYTLGTFGTQRLGSQQELEYRRGLWDVNVWRADSGDALGEFLVRQVNELKRRYGRVPPINSAQGAGRRLRKNARKRLYRDYVAFADAQRPDLLPYVEANDRASLILREHLAPQQRIELAGGGFYVRGTINRLYRVELGNGFQIVDPVTHVPTVSLCLHPDDWMPYADVALATKLAIDAGAETEAELLEAARPRVLPSTGTPYDRERAAYRLETRFGLYP